MNGNCSIQINVSTGSAGIVTLDALRVYLAAYDRTPPVLNIDLPVNQVNYVNGSFKYTVSDAMSNLDKCWFDLDGTLNYTAIADCNNYSIALTEATHYIQIFANDTNNNINTSANITFITDLTAPNMSDVRVEPTLSAQDENVTIYVTVSDGDNVTSIWGNVIRLGTSTGITFSDNSSQFSGTNETGEYNVTVWANDTAGNKVEYNTSFSVKEAVRLMLNVTNSTGTDMGLLVEITYANEIVSNITANETSDSNIGNSSYKIRFVNENATFITLIPEFNITENMTIEAKYEVKSTSDVPSPSAGTVLGNVIAFDPNVSAYSQVCLSYANITYQSVSNLKVFKVAWNFSSGASIGSQSQLSTTVDTNFGRVCANVTSFSAFSVGENPYNGDGVCDASESCSISDCTSASRCSSGGGGGGSTITFVPTTANETEEVNETAVEVTEEVVVVEEPEEEEEPVTIGVSGAAAVVEDRIADFETQELSIEAQAKLEEARQAFLDGDYELAQRLLNDINALKSKEAAEIKAAEVPVRKPLPMKIIVIALSLVLLMATGYQEWEHIERWFKRVQEPKPQVKKKPTTTVFRKIKKKAVPPELLPLWDIEKGKFLLLYLQEMDELIELGELTEATDIYREAMSLLEAMRVDIPDDLELVAQNAIKARHTKIFKDR